METIYYTTKKTYIRPKKVVDLMEYKRSMEQKKEILPAEPYMDADYEPVVLSAEHRERRRTLLEKLRDVADTVTSLVLTLCAIAAISMLI